MKFLSFTKRALALLLVLSMFLVACACSSSDEEKSTKADDADKDSSVESESDSEEKDSESKSESASESESESASESETDSESESESQSETDSETDSESDSETESESESETETEKKDDLLANDILLSGEPTHRIVYADGFKSLANKVLIKISDLDKNYKAGKYEVVLDTAVPEDGKAEIVIGNTNRAISKSAKNLLANKSDAYAVCVSGQSIAVYATSNKGLEAAVVEVTGNLAKRGSSVVYSNTNGSYFKNYDSSTIASELLTTLTNAAKTKNMPVLSISVGTTSGINSTTIKGGNPCQNCYSVTKVYCVTAIGILFDQGKIKVTDTIGEIFESEIKSYGVSESKWADITIHDVMRHRAGFTQGGFLDIDSQDATKWGSQDYLELVLKAELSGNKGYKYTDGAFYLISRVVSKISGKNLDEFLAEHLFNKTDCREYAFASCPQGYPIGATGLYIRSEDVAKLGRIYLDGGMYNGKRIISKAWVDLVLENGYELGKSGTGYAKGGMRGQNLYINFTKNVAVAWHAYTDHDLGSTLNNYMA